jgi:hypothetical protein
MLKVRVLALKRAQEYEKVNFSLKTKTKVLAEFKTGFTAVESEM